MKMTTLAALYVVQLQDSRSSEQQIIKALPKMVKAATHPDLKKVLKDHLDVSKEHLERLDLILADLGKSARRKLCEATVGLIKEGSEMIEGTEEGDVRDLALICAAQKIEHYEIACYGCLRTFAAFLRRNSDVKRLDKTLAEEKNADSVLTEVSVSLLNENALAAV